MLKTAPKNAATTIRPSPSKPGPPRVRCPAPWLTSAEPRKAAANASHSTGFSRSCSTQAPISTMNTEVRLERTPAFVAVV